MLQTGREVGAIAVPQKETAITMATNRLHNHNARLADICATLDQLCGGVPTDTSEAKRADHLGGQLGVLQDAIESQDATLGRIEYQLSRLFKGN